MAKFLQFALVIVILLVVALTAALLQPEWARDLGLQGETWTTLQCELFGDSNNAPDAEVAALQANWEVKWHLVADLIAHRVTLFEAAALFRQLNGRGPQLPYFYLGDSEEEHLCRQVIQWAIAQKPGAECIASLEEGLRRHKEQHGSVILPDVVNLEYNSQRARLLQPVPDGKD